MTIILKAVARIHTSIPPQMPTSIALLVAGIIHGGAMFVPLPSTPKPPKRLPVSVKVASLPTPSPAPSAPPAAVVTHRPSIVPKVVVSPSPIVRPVMPRQIVLPQPSPTPLAPRKQQSLANQSQQTAIQPTPSATPSPTPSPSAVPTPTPSSTPSPKPSPKTTGGLVLNQAGGQSCGENCTQVPPGFTYQDFRQQVSVIAEGELEEIRDEESEALLGWQFLNRQGQPEYWYRLSLTGPNQQIIDRYYQLPQLYESQNAMQLAIGQLSS